MALEAILLVLALLALVMALLPGPAVWWTLSAWAYRDPSANEPSPAGYAARRLSLGVMGAVGLVAWFSLLDSGASSDAADGTPDETSPTRPASTAEKLRDAVARTERQIDGTTLSGTVEDARGTTERLVSETARGSDLSVEITARPVGGDRFTVTAEGTTDSYCLSVRLEAGRTSADGSGRRPEVALTASVAEDACAQDVR